LHGVYGDAPPDTTWSEAIEPIARRLIVENRSRKPWDGQLR
jgi:hypothetical protein